MLTQLLKPGMVDTWYVFSGSGSAFSRDAFLFCFAVNIVNVCFFKERRNVGNIHFFFF